MTHSDQAHARVIHRELKRKVAQYGNREFFRFEDQVFGYQDFDQQSDRVAAALQGLGVAKGDKVAIMMTNRPEYLFVWFGLSKLGAVEVPINTAHRGELLAYMLDMSDSRVIVVEDEFLDRLEPILDQLDKLESVVVLSEDCATLPTLSKPTHDYRALVKNDGSFDPAEVLWSDPFTIMFTSGTTGPSKGSVMPQNYALYMGEIIMESAGYDDSDRLYNALPLFHGNAQLLSTMPALMSGARMVLAKRFSASRFWPEIKEYGCTEFNYIGGILQILAKADPNADDADNPIRVMVGAGAPPDFTEMFEKRFGVTLIEGYGMSEIGIPMINTLQDRKSGTCGRMRHDYDIKLVDDDGNEVGVGQPGEALLRPQKPYCILLEYYNMPAQTVEAWRDLWFHTGDYLQMDEDGYYGFVDRKKDAIRRRGENISSFEVEESIRSHPAVLECAAVAVKSEMGEDEVMVCLTVKPGQELSPEKLIDHCQEQMAYFMIPRYLRFMDALPKTPTERVRKFELRKQGVTNDTWDLEKSGIKLKR